MQVPTNQREATKMKMTIVGIVLAKNVFQVHGVDQRGKVVVRKRLRRQQVLRFENKAIVSAMITNEYYPYLFEPQVCTRTKLTPQSALSHLADPHLRGHCQNLPQDTNATAPRRPYSITSSRNTGLSSRPNWPARANTCPLSFAGNLMGI